jgi:NADH-quinone oxidoreductase subunit J
MTYITVLFYVFAFLAIVSAVYVVTAKNIVHSAYSLFVTLFSIAGFYVLLKADFIAVTQLMVYIGGILILMLFGIMLTQKVTDVEIKVKLLNIIPSVIFTVGITALLLFVILTTKWRLYTPIYLESTVDQIGIQFLTGYLLPFEVASVVLLVALIGASMYARKTK